MRATIKLKLGLTFATIVGLSLAIAGIGIRCLASVNTTMTSMVKGPVQKLRWAEEEYNKLLWLVRD